MRWDGPGRVTPRPCRPSTLSLSVVSGTPNFFEAALTEMLVSLTALKAAMSASLSYCFRFFGFEVEAFSFFDDDKWTVSFRPLEPFDF